MQNVLSAVLRLPLIKSFIFGLAVFGCSQTGMPIDIEELEKELSS